MKEEYEDLALEFEQQKRQNEKTIVDLETKEQELHQVGAVDERDEGIY